MMNPTASEFSRASLTLSEIAVRQAEKARQIKNLRETYGTMKARNTERDPKGTKG